MSEQEKQQHLSKVTAAQYLKAKEICERNKEPFDITEWKFLPFNDPAIGRWCFDKRIFIGIERDGYAHS